MYAIALIIVVYIYVRFAIWAVKWVSGRYASRRSKWVAGTVVVVVFVLIPIGDEIAGRMYFNHLCATEAGVKVYQTVELPAEYWDEQGKARFIKPNGDLNKTILGSRFDEPTMKRVYSKLFGVDEHLQKVVDSATHAVLGEVVTFMHWGGWVSRNLTPHQSATDCTEFHGNRFWIDFYSRLFNKPHSSNK